MIALNGIGSTAENVMAAIDGETYRYAKTCPPMLARADADRHKAQRMFDYATKAEKVHPRIHKMALDALKQG